MFSGARRLINGIIAQCSQFSWPGPVRSARQTDRTGNGVNRLLKLSLNFAPDVREGVEAAW